MKVKTKIIKGVATLLIAVLLFVALPVGEVKAQSTLYVDDDFDSSTPGWGTTHFSSILEAINAASSGDIIEVADGLYGPATTETDNPSTDGLFTIGKPLTIKAAAGVRPIINGSGVDGIFKIWHSGPEFTGGEVVIEGFDLTGDGATGIAITAAMCATADTTKIIIKDNLFHGMIGGFHPWGSGSFCTDPGQEARVENVEIIGNEFYDLGAAGVHGGFGVYFEGLSDWAAAGNQFALKVDDNVFRDIIDVPGTDGGAGVGINSPNAANNEAANAQIVNNSFEDTVNIGVAILGGDVSDTEIMYNDFADSTVGVLNNDAGTVNATRNWWSYADGPVASQYVGSVDFTPWYATDTTTAASENVSVERGGVVVAYSDTIQGAIAAASDGDKILVSAGTYVETGQLLVEKDLTIIGEDKTTTFIKPSGNLGSYLIKGSDGHVLNISNVTLDGDGFTVYGGVSLPQGSTGTIDNNIIKNFYSSKYLGFGVVAYGDNSIISNNQLSNIERVGIWVGAANVQVTGNTYTGKGVGDWLDYGIEVGYGGTATLSGNTISDCLGVASSDDSESGGIMATDYFGGGTQATVTNNILTGNSYGLMIGYEDTDATIVTATGNNFTNNQYQIDAMNATNINIADALANNTFDRAVVIDGGFTIYSSIQEAIDDSSDGDTINVWPGTYDEKLELNKPNITVQSTDGADVTILDVPDGHLTTGVKVLANMGTVTFDGFTVKDFTESGIVQGMSAREGTTFHVLNNKVIPAADYLRNGIQVSGDGSTVIGNFVEGAYLTTDWASTAIGVVNASNVLVENNEVSGSVNGIDYGIAVYTWDYDPAIVESVHDVQVLNNKLYNVDYPLDATAYHGTVYDITYEYNHVTNYVDALWAEPYTASGYDGISVTGIDASPNWWGSKYGPLSPIYGADVTVIQWCANEACTEFLPDAGNIIELSGNINEPGGIPVYVPGITFILLDGTVIQNDSPCFDINADNTKITTASLGGATCVPTGSSNGIDVADGLTNIIIEGIEIDGSGQDTGDGIHFAGAITDVILRDNLIHDLDGDGVEFSAALAGTVQVQGNLFMDNGGFGLNAVHYLDVTYNAWGDVDGPVTGDDLPAYVVASSFIPWTHVDLYMESSGTDVVDEVREGETITYTIYANLREATGADFKLSFDPAVLEVSGTTLGTIFTEPAVSGGQVIEYDNVAGEIHFAGVPVGGAEQSGKDLTLFTVTFTGKAAGVSGLAFGEDEFGMSPPSGPSNNIYAAALVDGSATVRNHYTVTATVSMQGRTVRSGIEVTLTTNTGIAWGPFQATSTAPISDNVFMTGVVENTYDVTIDQDRYLDVTTASGITVDVNADLTLTPLELFGGDVEDDEIIDVSDASLIGANYYGTGAADANFDGIVNIFDLALVGGNYGLESATAYGSWTP